MRFREVASLTPPFFKGGRGGICKVPTGATVVEIPPNPPLKKGGTGALDEWRHTLLSRRTFLLASAGGLAALFAPAGALAATANPWPVLAAVQNHLFPSELGSPGAREINALSYLQGVLADPRGDREEQRFILKGVDRLEDLSRRRHQASFVALDSIRREQVLREVANARPGENWISTLLLYLCEALLTDPVYGGNPDCIGWAWLEHQPGFPRPTPDKKYGSLK